jgi:YegS/Rv2252/BmrU family lipid kinase
VKPLLIVNPASGGGRTGRLWPELRRTIENAVGTCEVEMTKAPGHAIDIARHATGFDRIISVGGDGTFSEVAAGVVEGKVDAAVGLIHQGTGGDFRKTLGMEHRLDVYIGAIGRGETRLVDVGRVEYTGLDGTRQSRPFVNAISIGMGGLVDKYVGEGSKMLGAKATYLTASLKAVMTGAVGRAVCELESGGKTETLQFNSRIVAMCNGQYFGGGMQIAPMAKLDDGLLEFLAFTGGGRIPLLTAMNSVYSGGHLKNPSVQHRTVSAVTFRLLNEEANDRFLLDVDGEYLGHGPLRVTLVPKALRVLA